MRVGNEREVAGLRVAELGLWCRETAREGAGSRAGQVKLAPQWRGGGWRRNGRTDGRRRGLAVRDGEKTLTGHLTQFHRQEVVNGNHLRAGKIQFEY